MKAFSGGLSLKNIWKSAVLAAMVFSSMLFSVSEILAGEVAGKAPEQVGDFILGRSIDEFKNRIKKDSRMCIRYKDYLEEVEIKTCSGFKSGLISIANCSNTKEILRIKLKYADSSRKFFDTLLEHFKAQFGQPDKWKGDPFGVMLVWKWSFENEKGERISLILQNNTQDKELKMGNVVKLANTTRIERERECFLSKRASEEPVGKPVPLDFSKPEVWNYLIPR